MSDDHQQKIEYLEELNSNVLSLTQSCLFVLNRDLEIVRMNKNRCDFSGLKNEEIVGKSALEVFPKTLLHDAGVARALHKVRKTKEPVNLTDVRLKALNSQSARTLNIKIRAVGSGEALTILINIDDVSERVEKIFELSMLRYVNGAIAEGGLKLKSLLNLILTCVTAGSALGFNRAFLLFVDGERTRVKGKIGIGPANREEAYRIWSYLGSENKTLQDLLSTSVVHSAARDAHLGKIIRRMNFPLNDRKNLVAASIIKKRPYRVSNALMDPNVSIELRDLMGSNEFVIVPMVVRDRAIGAIIADNIYSMNPISEEHVQLLTMFANQAGLAIEVTEMYKKLERERNKLKEAYRRISDTQDKLIEAERLAAVGKMAAYVSHEIRNPLVTIGGYAKTILKHRDNARRTDEDIKIIIKEVNRLEKILSEVLEFSKPFKPSFHPQNINRVIKDTCILIEKETNDKKITLKKDLSAGLPKSLLDTKQITQALLNIFKNSIYAMPRGGEMHISSQRENDFLKISIRDSGKGIPKEILDKLFIPFFTTKKRGFGIGLAVTDRIIKDHGGRIEVKSAAGEGTTFIVYLPVSLKYNEPAVSGTDFY